MNAYALAGGEINLARKNRVMDLWIVCQKSFSDDINALVPGEISFGDIVEVRARCALSALQASSNFLASCVRA